MDYSMKMAQQNAPTATATSLMQQAENLYCTANRIEIHVNEVLYILYGDSSPSMLAASADPSKAPTSSVQSFMSKAQNTLSDTEGQLIKLIERLRG